MADQPQPNGKRREIADRIFVGADGSREPTAQPNTIAGEFHFSNGHVIHVDFARFSDGVRACAMSFGAMTSIGNTMGSAKLSQNDQIEAAEARVETLYAGTWRSERQIGPRIGDVLEAMIEFRAEKGKPSDPSWIVDVRRKMEAEEPGWTARKILSDYPAVQAKVDAIRARRAAERAEKSREAAGTAPTADPSGLLA